MTEHPKKLIEVALPLEDINAASAREKSIRHGHPSTLHLWWARRPLAAARAVLFAQLVDDPSGYVDELWEDSNLLVQLGKKVGRPVAPHEKDEHFDEILISMERERLFDIIRQLVLWENTNNESVLEPAREEIRVSWRRTCRREGKPEDTPLPPFLDPFAGGGAIPLEAQRLGLESHASDLNPVAVLINKAMIEIPPKFANLPPVHPDARNEMGTTGWKGAAGLAEDVRRYGQWMRDEAENRIGNLYPPYELTQDLIASRPDLQHAGFKAGDKLTVIAWLWARTVASPNPALSGKEVPLVSSYWLSKKKGKEAWVEPVIENGGYRFDIRIGKAAEPEVVGAGTKTGRGANFRCLLSGSPIDGKYIKSEGMARRMGARLMTVVCESKKGRVYLPPSREHEVAANTSQPEWRPSQKLAIEPRAIWCVSYGLDDFASLFTDRQLVALNTFSDLITEARELAILDANNSSELPSDSRTIEASGIGTEAYADALTVYLAFAIDKCADYWSSICSWHSSRELIRNTFGRQAIPMAWDYAETNAFSSSSGTYTAMLDWVWKVIQRLPTNNSGHAIQADASTRHINSGSLISTDPPYYDNIGYADLSDYFYVWIRRALRSVFPGLCSTLLVPKSEELIASPYRHGGKSEAEDFFLHGMTGVAKRLADATTSGAPTTIYYAFKQAESAADGVSSTGWATFLEALLISGFSIVGTWPMRTELSNRMVGSGTNALASSIVLVCRQRSKDAAIATRREFVQALQRELPKALRELQHGNIAPVDLPQSSIGPGMAIFSRYSKVLESDGTPLKVKTALQLINSAVDEFLSEQEAQMDDWTRFAVTWFSQYGFEIGPFGDAQNVANARNVSVEGVRDAGILESGGGKVRLLQINELESDWDPKTDKRITVWEVTHHLIKRLEEKGESTAAQLLKDVGGMSEDARSLCYRLYTLCEQKKWTDEARAYNGLITLWPQLGKLATTLDTTKTLTQDELGI